MGEPIGVWLGDCTEAHIPGRKLGGTPNFIIGATHALDMVECQNCGEEVSKEDAVSGSGGVKEEGAQKLMGGETVGASELFSFNEYYCSIGCAIED